MTKFIQTFILGFTIVMSSLVAQAQFSISPAPSSGEVVLTASNTYIYLTNTTSSPFVPSISLASNSNGISLSLNRCTTSLKANQSCYVVVSFPSYSTNSQTISLALNNSASPITTLKFNPTVVAPQTSNFSVSSLSLNDFNSTIFIIQNKTSSTKSYSPVIGGTDASKYSITINRCNSIPANGTCQVYVKLAPQMEGSYSASITEPQVTGSLSISSTITGSTVGVVIPPNPSVWFDDSGLSYGTITQLGATGIQTVTIRNDGNVPVSPIVSVTGTGYEIALNRCLSLIGPQQTCTVSIVFRAIASMNNGAKSGSISAKATISSTPTSIPLSAFLNVNPILLTSSQSNVGSSESIFGITYNSAVYYLNKFNNTLSMWGHNGYYNIGNGNNENQLYSVLVSDIPPLSTKTISQFSMFGYHGCALTTTNEMYCWGYNNGGQIGSGSTNFNAEYPTQVDQTGVLAGKTISKINVGLYTTCAITSENLAYCWGANGSGQTGTNHDPQNPPYIQSIYSPEPLYMGGVLSGKTIKEIVGTYSHSCAIASDDRVYCWGSGSSGKMGNGADDNAFAPVAVDWSGVLAGKTAKKISMTYSNVCIIASDDQVYCWGSGYSGVNGNGSESNSNVPVAVDWSGVLSGKTAKKLYSNPSLVCIIANDDLPYCWGGNYTGLLGDGSGSYSSVPVAVDMTGAMSGKTVKKLAMGVMGGSTACAIGSDDKLYCWGGNGSGQLGDGTTDNSNVPVAVDPSGLLASLSVSDVAVEGNNTCVRVSQNGNVYCIGSNYAGQLGNGTQDSSGSFVLSSSGQ